MFCRSLSRIFDLKRCIQEESKHDSEADADGRNEHGDEDDDHSNDHVDQIGLGERQWTRVSREAAARSLKS